jgi:hypothetical protein
MTTKEIIEVVGVEVSIVSAFFLLCLLYVTFWRNVTGYLDKPKSVRKSKMFKGRP